MRKILLGVSALSLSLLPVASVVSCSNDKDALKKNQINKFKDTQSKNSSVEAVKVKEAINCGKNLDIKKIELLKYFDIPTLDKGFIISEIEAELDPYNKRDLKMKVFIKDNSARNNSKKAIAEFKIRGFKAPVIKLNKIDIKPKDEIWSSEFRKLSDDYDKKGITNSDKIKILSKIFSGINQGNFNQFSVEKTSNKFTLKAIDSYTFGNENERLVSSISSKNPKESMGELTSDIVKKNFETEGKWSGKTSITALDLDGYSSIGEWAFWQQNHITEIELPESVIVIGKWAFENLQLNCNFVIPDSVINIEEGAFKNANITNLVIGNSVVNIGPDAFSNNKLSKLVIPDSVISIGNSAFFGNNLTEVEFGISLIDVGYYAFAKNKFATDPKLPNQIIDKKTFVKTNPNPSSSRR